MKPTLKLLIDPAADLKNAKGFFRYGKYLEWFLPDPLEFLLTETVSIRKRNQELTTYIEEFYRTHQKQIADGVAKTKAVWKRHEAAYLKLVSEVFGGHPWPAGIYTGYASIFCMYPRHIDERKFFFPYQARRVNPVRTIGHEMLHFLFFDYIKNHYGIGEQTKLKGKSDRYVWCVSENVNTLMENWEPYNKILNPQERATPYSECRALYKKMRAQWNKDPDVKKLLDQFLGTYERR